MEELRGTKMRVVWLSDLHLNFVSDADVELFAYRVDALKPDTVLLSGDISDSRNLHKHLEILRFLPMYYVLGNHDYYHGSISAVRKSLDNDPQYLSNLGVVRLARDIAVIGADGWADMRNGCENSSLQINDDYLIWELSNICSIKDQKKAVRQRLADADAQHIANLLPDSLAENKVTIVLTHVPPFIEVCVPGDSEGLPYFSSKSMGQVIVRSLNGTSSGRCLVLCGHAHTAVVYMRSQRLVIMAAQAEYGKLAIANIFEF